MEIWDIGHSTRTEKDFMAFLHKNRIEAVVDVRRFPSSIKFPHFCKNHLEKVLGKNSIDYLWLGEKLGGFRRGGYENWVSTDEFTSGINELEEQALEKRTAFMCAEADFARCHRKFIIQTLELKGWTVHHISSLSKRHAPSLTSPLFSDKE